MEEDDFPEYAVWIEQFMVEIEEYWAMHGDE
jgi:hypothetical protein